MRSVLHVHPGIRLRPSRRQLDAVALTPSLMKIDENRALGSQRPPWVTDSRVSVRRRDRNSPVPKAVLRPPDA